MNCSTPCFPMHHQLLELTQTHVHRVSDVILCCPLLCLPSIFPSVRVFSDESVLCIRWAKYWSFSFSLSPSNEYSGLISFRIDWFDLLAVQGTFKSLLQHHSSKESILQCSAFFTVQLSDTYMTTGKTITLTRQTLVGKVMSLLSNMLSRLMIAFLPSSKHLLISWLQSPSAVILEPLKINSVTVSIVFPSICQEVMESDAMILGFECWVLRQVFHSPLSLSSRGSLVPLCFLPLKWYYLHVWGCGYFSWQSWFQIRAGQTHRALNKSFSFYLTISFPLFISPFGWKFVP